MKLPKSYLGLRDLLSESTVALTARPARTLLTALGTVLGVAALVATLGLAKTAASQIVSRFDELSATRIVVRPDNRSARGGEESQSSVIPWDSQDRLERLNGVKAAGNKSRVSANALVRSVAESDGRNEFQLSVIAVSPGTFDAVRAELFTGRFFDEGHSENKEPVALLGPGAARRLNVVRVDNQPAVFIGDVPVAVIGILSDVAREPDLLNAVIITEGFARDRFDLQAPEEVHIDIDVGAAGVVGTQTATALYPNEPQRLQVSVPASPVGTRSSVQGDLNALFLVLGGISLLVGAIGIANVTLVSVLERRGEIGLRRALGASRRHIASQFLFESAALGTLAGIIGTALGILTIVAVSANQQWSPVIDPWLPLAAPIAGGLIGLLAGTYPAWKASATEPISALRST